jgi:hypothetical protein
MKGGSYISKDGKLTRVEGTEAAPLPQRKRVHDDEGAAADRKDDAHKTRRRTPSQES